jgi:hypothetical protein
VEAGKRERMLLRLSKKTRRAARRARCAAASACA